MIGGFALVAAPAEYNVTGVRTFIVSQDGGHRPNADWRNDNPSATVAPASPAMSRAAEAPR
jgi:hypothetical protein